MQKPVILAFFFLNNDFLSGFSTEEPGYGHGSAKEDKTGATRDKVITQRIQYLLGVVSSKFGANDLDQEKSLRVFRNNPSYRLIINQSY